MNAIPADRVARADDCAPPATAAAAAAAPNKSVTVAATPHNAADRNFADIDFQQYCLQTFVLTGARSVVLHPLFIVTTRKQVCSASGSKTFLQIVRLLREKEGGAMRGLSQGVIAMALGMAVSETFFNAVYEYTRYALEQRAGLPLTTATAAGAWIGDWGSRVVFSPFNVICVRQIMFNSPSAEGASVRLEHNGLRHVVRRSFQSGGLRSFYSGIGLVLVFGSLTSSIFFATYVHSKKLLYGAFTPWLQQMEEQRRREQIQLLQEHPHGRLPHAPGWRLPDAFYDSTDNFVLNSTSSLLASCLAATVVNPYLVVLGKVQAGVSGSAREAFRQVMVQSGWRGFFRGAVASTFATIFDSWLTSTTYEYAMSKSAR